MVIFPSSSCSPECADSHEGSYECKQGEFSIYYNSDPNADLIGWFWRLEGALPEGPYDKSREAYEAALQHTEA